MDSPLKLSGETLIVHHIPLVHCQIADRQCCSSIKRANPFCQPDLGLTRTTSLPERDVLLKEDLVYSSLIKASSSGGGDKTKVKEYAGKGNHKQRYNPFLLNAKDKKQFDGYQEDSSFHLHVNSNTNTDKHSSFHFTPHSFLLHENMETSLRSATAISHRLGAAEGRESVGCNLMMNNPNCCNTKTMERLVECLDLSGHHCQQRNGSSGSTLSMDCGEQEWNSSPPEEDDQLREDQQSHPCSCCSSMDFNHPPSSANRCRCCFYSFSDPSEINDEQMGYVSDSSCNSSDGVLVNFSTIYNKMKNDVPSKSLNMNSEDQSCESSIGSHSEPGVAFYLDLHTSPLESQGGCSQGLGGFSSGFDHTSNYQQSPDTLDANCNSYHLNCEAGPGLSDGSDVTSCFQSQARLVVATQNYYKLVTCDLSSQSSPSPAGSSIASCSDEHNKSSPSQPTEYYLFQKPEDNEQGKWFEQQGDSKDDETIEDQMAHSVIEGQVYINVSPPNMHSTGRPRSRSYDRHLHKSPSPRLGSLERMMSCPVKLSESSSHFSHHSSPPRRVTSFAEIARSKKRSNSLNGSSPPLRKSSDSSSQDITPVSDIQLCMGECHSLPPMPLLHCYNQGNYDLESAAGGSPFPASIRSTGTKTLHLYLIIKGPALKFFRYLLFNFSFTASFFPLTGGSISDGRAIIRYSKEQRPTTLPIQPFVFQHQLSKPHAKLRPLLSDYISQMYNRPIGQPASDSVMQREDKEDGVKKTSPDSVRLSPLGSYSPVHNGDSSPETCSTCTPTPDRSSKPPRSRSCPVSASLLPIKEHSTQTWNTVFLLYFHFLFLLCLFFLCLLVILSTYSSSSIATGLKWREYRRKNPLGLGAFSSCSSTWQCGTQGEFCLSPDAATESISIDIVQKRELVKAMNTAVDLIVAHFGNSRDPSVKAKLGNSSVSPNVGHLILKYLCPAIHAVLSDGLKPFILDVIIGQRRNVPWSVVEASAQLGPSTKLLYSLYGKISQYSELTSHTMRFNAFIFGLLNMKSVEFWFNHLYNCEDVVTTHYHQWGFLPLSQGVCHLLFEELLLLLQPLSLLPFDLDLLFEHRLLQKSHDHFRRKEQLCLAGQGLEQSVRSTFQLMRGWGVGSVREVVDAHKERKGRNNTGEENGVRPKDRNAGWWYQLMQSSQVYMNNSSESSRFVKSEKRKKTNGLTDRQIHPPPREGVVEGAEAGPNANIEKDKGSGVVFTEKGKASWMGSPPESVLNDLKKSKEKEFVKQENKIPAVHMHVNQELLAQRIRWGRLFGADLSTSHKRENLELPSGWLNLEKSWIDMLWLVTGYHFFDHYCILSFHREVRALCHHIATEPGQLSFKKGDVLQVLGKADHEWLHCRLGSLSGLVPIIYVTLPEESCTLLTTQNLSF
uniref:RUN and SH3 domain containing 2 n=1 Tax=Erpetoichthys calabaricus TaxID=27687 RepID=A0A8C4S302_ERPCA